MKLETKRLNLRYITVNDAFFLIDLFNQDSFLKHFGDRKVKTKEEAILYIKDKFLKSYEANGYGHFLVELKDKNIPIGLCGVTKRDFLDDADIGFIFSEKYFRKGYATEASNEIIRYAKEDLKLEKIIGVCSKSNKASIITLEKLGFIYEKEIDMKGYDKDSKLYFLSLLN